MGAAPAPSARRTYAQSRNTLAVLQAIAHQSLRAPGSTQDFVERFGCRLAALASLHTLLVNS
jgi:two-component sensor histidine kinase